MNETATNWCSSSRTIRMRARCTQRTAVFRLPGRGSEGGIEAIEKAAELMPDIILMDLALPKMDGWEATRRLKIDERTRHIPIVALTGHALAGHAEGARQAGCDSFVTKPCLPDALVAEIQRMLAAREGAEGSGGGPGKRPRTPTRTR
jgi:CheY-like chemotaxis protein